MPENRHDQRPQTRRCPAEKNNGQQCVLIMGIDNHDTRVNNDGLRLPLPIHRAEDGTDWTQPLGRIH